MSDGRNTDQFKTGIELFLLSDQCPNADANNDGKVGKRCSYDLTTFRTFGLDPGETDAFSLNDTQYADEVTVEDAPALLDAIVGDTGVVVSADRVFPLDHSDLDKYNPACPLPKSDVQWVTYFSESSKVDACSTEPGAK